MSLIDLLGGNEKPEQNIRKYMEFEGLQEEVGYLRGELREAQEDLLKISDAFDNVGWSPLSEEESKDIPLKTVKKIAEVARAMVGLNPFIKRGVEARISYVWGKGVTFDGIDGISDVMNHNRKKLFTPQVYMELERALATDGNVFTALPVDNDNQDFDTVIRIPLDNITGVVTNPIDPEEIWYYKVERTEKRTNSQTGEVTSKQIIKYYASTGYWKKKDGVLPKRFNKVGVEQNYVLQHTAVNRQVGWKWGLPDLTSVIFWAKAYKEYLEDNALLVKAYSRLAWNYRPSTSAGAQAAGAQIMRPPTRDPLTGEMRDVGGTSIAFGGEMQALPATGSTVDFDKGSALASAIAAGLEVSKVVITSDPGSGNRATAETLDLPTLKAMESRQQLHTERFMELFEFWGAPVNSTFGSTDAASIREAQEADDNGDGVQDRYAKPQSDSAKGPSSAIVTWPQIETDTTKDRVAAIVQATTDAHLLYPEEARKELIDVFGVAPYKPWNEVPKPEDDPYKQYEAEQAEVAFNRETQRAEAEAKVVASQGNSGGVANKGGAMNSNNSARDNRNADRNNS